MRQDILQVQGASEPISRILTQFGIGVALKPQHSLFSLFLNPKGVLIFNKNVVWCIKFSWRDCNAVYIGKTGCSARTRKRAHVDAVKTFNTKKSALSQHVMDFNRRVDWDYVKNCSQSHVRTGAALRKVYG